MSKQLFFLLLTILFSISVNAFVVKDSTSPKLYIKAVKKNNSYTYKVGNALKVWYTTNDALRRAKGYVTHISNDSIQLTSFNKKKRLLKTIAISDVAAISEISIKAKKSLLITLFITILVTIPLVFLALATTSIFSYLLLIPSGLIFFGLEISFLILYLIQSLSKKAKRNGWQFNIVNK